MRKKTPTLLFAAVVAILGCDDEQGAPASGQAKEALGVQHDSHLTDTGLPTALASGSQTSGPQPNPEAAAKPEVPLRIATSDAPAWLAWAIAEKKGWFAAAGVSVELSYYDYVPSLEAYAAGKADGVTMTNRDLLLTTATGVRSTAVLINATSFGNDVIIARKGVNSLPELRGKRFGVELGFSSHSLVLQALASEKMSTDDVEFVNLPTPLAPKSLKRRDVDAIATREPFASSALKEVPGAHALFSTRKAPGLFYQLLCVNPESLRDEREAWLSITLVWQRIVNFINDSGTHDEAMAIMADQAGVPEEAMSRLVAGTRFSSLEENRRHFVHGTTLDSLSYSTEIANGFHVEQGLQESKLNVRALLDGSLVNRQP